VLPGNGRSPEFIQAAARLFAREAVAKVYFNGLKVAQGYGERIEEVLPMLKALDLSEAMVSSLEDMDTVAAGLIKETA
jgi:hypothetical protein